MCVYYISVSLSLSISFSTFCLSVSDSGAASMVVAQAALDLLHVKIASFASFVSSSIMINASSSCGTPAPAADAIGRRPAGTCAAQQMGKRSGEGGVVLGRAAMGADAVAKFAPEIVIQVEFRRRQLLSVLTGANVESRVGERERGSWLSACWWRRRHDGFALGVLFHANISTSGSV